jgi:hypothetical protein
MAETIMTAVKTFLGLWNSLTHVCEFLNFQIQWMNVKTVCTAVWIGNCVHCSVDWKLCALQCGLETVCTAVWPYWVFILSLHWPVPTGTHLTTVQKHYFFSSIEDPRCILILTIKQTFLSTNPNTPCILTLSKFFYSPTDAQLNCLKNNFKIDIKIDIKTASTCFGAITIISGRIIRQKYPPNKSTRRHMREDVGLNTRLRASNIRISFTWWWISWRSTFCISQPPEVVKRTKGERVGIICSFVGEVKRAYKMAYVGKPEQKTSWKT